MNNILVEKQARRRGETLVNLWLERKVAEQAQAVAE